MTPLTIELKSGERQRFNFIGWHTDRTAFYVRDEDGNAKFVELSSPYPHNLDDGQPFAFPLLEPTEIFATRLVPPSCVTSQADINEFATRLHEIVLYPQRKHEPALRRSLKWCHAKAGKDQATEIAGVKNATSLELFPYDAFQAAGGTPKTPRKLEEIEAERQRQIREIKEKYRSRLTLTLERLKRGEDDYALILRNHILISGWAKETGTDLEKMNQAAQEFAGQWFKAGGTEHQLAPENMRDDRVSQLLWGGAGMLARADYFNLPYIPHPSRARLFSRAGIIFAPPTASAKLTEFVSGERAKIYKRLGGGGVVAEIHLPPVVIQIVESSRDVADLVPTALQLRDDYKKLRLWLTKLQKAFAEENTKEILAYHKELESVARHIDSFGALTPQGDTTVQFGVSWLKVGFKGGSPLNAIRNMFGMRAELNRLILAPAGYNSIKKFTKMLGEQHTKRGRALTDSVVQRLSEKK